MDAIVLCGGSGSRVREHTKDEIPKILIPIDGEPFISHVIDSLLMQGIRSIIFAAGIHGDQIVDYLETRLSLPQKRYGFFQTVVEDYPRGTGGAVAVALNHSDILSKKDDYILVTNGDSITFRPAFSVLKNHYTNYIWGTEAKNDGSFGAIKIGKKISTQRISKMYNIYKINSFSEKSMKGKHISNGHYMLSKKLFDSIPEVCSLEYDLIPKWVGKHEFYFVECHPGDKIDIGTSDRINNLMI
jgi:NDP-sugar pyrophosphorylase family protein